MTRVMGFLRERPMRRGARRQVARLTRPARILIAAIAIGCLGLTVGPLLPAAADQGVAITVAIEQQDPDTSTYTSSTVTQPSGSTFSYSVAVSCSIVGGSTCLTGGTVRIPLDPALLTRTAR